MTHAADTVRKIFCAYEQKDRQALEGLLTEDFTFSSPIDDKISREIYFRRCWPNSEHLKSFSLEKVFAEGEEVFVTYLATNIDGSRFRNTEFFRVQGDQVREVVVYFGSELGQVADESEIRWAIEDWSKHLRHKNVSGILEHVAKDSISYTLAPPLVAEGPLEKNLEEWFATFQTDIGYEILDLKIQNAGDVAFTESLNHLTGVKKDGTSVDLWFRETMGLRKIEGRWLIVHEHESVPFYMDGSGRAALDLKP